LTLYQLIVTGSTKHILQQARSEVSLDAREKLILISHLKVPCIQIGEEAYHTFWYAIKSLFKISSSQVENFALPGMHVMVVLSHLSGVSSCDRFACVVSEDFSEFLLVFSGVQFDPTDLEDLGFIGFGGSEF
jgi:hypothetical protein